MKCPKLGLLLFLLPVCLDSWPTHGVFTSVSATFVPRFRTVPSGADRLDGRVEEEKGGLKRTAVGHSHVDRRFLPRSGPTYIPGYFGASPKPALESLGPPLAWRECEPRHAGRKAHTWAAVARSQGRLCANGPLRICQKRSQPKRLSLSLSLSLFAEARRGTLLATDCPNKRRRVFLHLLLPLSCFPADSIEARDSFFLRDTCFPCCVFHSSWGKKERVRAPRQS